MPGEISRSFSGPPNDMVQCPSCQGQGVIKKWHGDRSPDRDCKYCNGMGEVREAKANAFHDLRS